MKKRYILGSVTVALLMLVSTQIFITNTVKSDPSCHYGDADVGELYISELDVSSAVSSFDYVAIAHSDVNDDWVCWEQGEGTVTVDCEVDIDDNHPEYLIMFSMGVYNIDDDCECIGSDSIYESYAEDTSAFDSGTLEVDVSFTIPQQAAGEATLVALFETQVIINNTVEAKNFTSVSHERCVIGVDFIWPRDSFPPFIIEANNEMPTIWSYLPDWQSAFSGSEGEMLNETTIVFGDLQEVQESSGSSLNPTWHFAEIEVIHEDPEDDPTISIDEVDNTTNWFLNWPFYDPESAVGLTKISYDFDTWNPVFNPYPHPFCLMGFRLKYNANFFALNLFYWNAWRLHERSIYDLSQALDGWIDPQDNNVYFTEGLVWILYGVNGWESMDISDYYLHVGNTEQNDDFDSPSTVWSWSDYCAHQKIETSKVGSVVEGNIASILPFENRVVYTYGGDTGDTTVELICEII